MSYDKGVMAERLRKLRREKSARENRDVTQREVAEHVGVSPMTITNYENGVGGVGYDVAWALADFYDVPIAALGGRDESAYSGAERG